MQTEDDIQRRRRMVQEAMQRGLQRPGQSLVERFQTPEQQTATSRQSFMPGESAGMPDSFWNRRFPFLRSTQQLREQQPNYAALGNNDTTPRPAVNIPPNAGLTPPEPATPNLDITGPVQPSESTSPSSKRVSFSSLGGLTGVGRLLEQRRITEAADPTSDVRIRGDNVDVTPPRMEGVNGLSRWRGLGQGLKVAAQGIDPDRPMFSLGALLGGGISGLASPRSAAKESRKLDLARLDNDIARGLKLEQEQAQLGGLEALRRQRELEPGLKAAELEQEREIANAKLEIERQKAAGEITQKEADRQQRELDRRSREGIAEANRASREKIAASRTSGADTREAKAAAAQQEYDSLLVEEEAARQEKDRAYGVLDQMRKSGQPKEDIAQAEDAAKAADKNYQSYAEKKREAQRRIRENQVSAPAAQPYAGRTMSQANLERYAKDKGLSIEEARRQVETQGVRVQ